MRKMISVSLFLSLTVLFSSAVFSHCQVPCGIYDDEVRIKMIAEHITTIEKAMKQVNELSKENAQNFNQMVRWIHNKEKHAEELSDIVTYYFMTQRLKPAEKTDTDAYKGYLKKLTLLHEMLVYTMKTKQTADLAHVEKLRSLLKEFGETYFGHKSEAKK